MFFILNQDSSPFALSKCLTHHFKVNLQKITTFIMLQGGIKKQNKSKPSVMIYAF